VDCRVGGDSLAPAVVHCPLATLASRIIFLFGVRRLGLRRSTAPGRTLLWQLFWRGVRTLAYVHAGIGYIRPALSTMLESGGDCH